jgi:hypothetical protein
MQPVTIICGPRDRFSVTERWLDRLFETTPGAGTEHRVIVVAGGAPEQLRESWASQFGDRVDLVFEEHFLNQAQVRNIGMAMADTDLAVLVDNDCYPRAGWLDAMVGCMEDTGAVMVSPLILETPDRIHCAGTDLYKNIRNGAEYGHKHLRYHRMPHHGGCNLDRSRIDYGELHLELVRVAPTIELQAFDERILEVGEVDSGLAWASGGHEMWFEPSAVVHFDLGGHIDENDIAFFAWRWEYGNLVEGYRVFKEKWGFDIAEEGSFHNFLLNYNALVGRLARRHPSPLTVKLGVQAKRASDRLEKLPTRVLRRFRAGWQGAAAGRPAGL